MMRSNFISFLVFYSLGFFFLLILSNAENIIYKDNTFHEETKIIITVVFTHTNLKPLDLGFLKNDINIIFIYFGVSVCFFKFQLCFLLKFKVGCIKRTNKRELLAIFAF